MNNHLDTEYYVLALYGFTPSQDQFRACYELQQTLQSEAGHVSEQAGVTITGVVGGKMLSLKAVDKKLKRCDFLGVTAFSVVGSDAFTTCWGGFTPAAFHMAAIGKKYLTFSTARGDHEWLRSVALRLCELLRPAYGMIYRRAARHSPSCWATGMGYGSSMPPDRLPPGWWSSFWLHHEVFNYGFIRDVFEMNFLADVVLDKPIDGLAFRDWITADPARGRLEKLTDEISLWSVETAAIPLLQEQLDAANVILTPTNLPAIAIRDRLNSEFCKRRDAKEAAERKQGLGLKLVKLLRTLDAREALDDGTPLLVSIEEFFDGNTQDESIAVNLNNHPGLKQFRSVLKQILKRETVQDVLIHIIDRPAAPENDDDLFEDEDWPYSDAVLVLTSSTSEEVAKWARKLQPDSVEVATWLNDRMPANAPELLPGMQLVRLWWD